MRNLAFDLADLNPIQREGYIELRLPVLLELSWSLITLRVTPHEDGSYTVSDNGRMFAERGNESTEFYYNHFAEHSEYSHYDIKVKGDFFYKDYAANYNPTAALNQFVRFFIRLEEHIELYEIL